jgi:hypothetical protein
VARWRVSSAAAAKQTYRVARGFVHLGSISPPPNVKLADSDLRVRLGQIAIKLQQNSDRYWCIAGAGKPARSTV